MGGIKITFVILVVLSIVIFSIEEIIFYLTHRRPLTEDEISHLATARRIFFINQHFKFSHQSLSVNPNYRSSLDFDGRWDQVDIPLCNVLALITQLLRYKRHEWFVLCLADEDKCKLIWANKGDDNESCYLKNSFEIVKAMATSNHCHTIIAMHNHPHTQERYWNLLSPSQVDKTSFVTMKKTFSDNDRYNVIDALCTQGQFIVYGYAFSESYIPPKCTEEEIVRENNISEKQNYKLHKELRKIRWKKIATIK